MSFLKPPEYVMMLTLFVIPDRREHLLSVAYDRRYEMAGRAVASFKLSRDIPERSMGILSHFASTDCLSHRGTTCPGGLFLFFSSTLQNLTPYDSWFLAETQISLPVIR